MNRLFEALAIAALLFMYATAAKAWSDAPARYPTHFNASGQPDKWGTRDGLWLLPVIGTGEYLILTALSRGNIRYNLPKGVDQDSPEVRGDVREMLTAIKAVTLLGMAYIENTIAQAASSESVTLGRGFLPIVIAGTLATVGFYLYRLRRHRHS